MNTGEVLWSQTRQSIKQISVVFQSHSLRFGMCLLTLLVLTNPMVCDANTITTEQLVESDISALKAETGFQRNVQVTLIESLHGLSGLIGAEFDVKEALLLRDMAAVAAEDNLIMGELGKLVGFLLDPVLWLMVLIVGYFSKSMASKYGRILLVAAMVLGVAALLTPQFAGSEIPRISATKIIGSLIYGWLSIVIFRTRLVSEAGSGEVIPAIETNEKSEGCLSANTGSDTEVSSSLEEKLLEEIVSDYRAGNVREGIWAKAVIEADGDETRAYARYLKLSLESAIQEQKT